MRVVRRMGRRAAAWAALAAAIVLGAALFAQSPGMAGSAPRRAVPAEEKPSLAKSCRRRAERAGQLLGAGCAVRVEPPWVISGDLVAAERDRWYQATIAPASAALASQFALREPDEPITVLLFRSEASYRETAGRVFGDRDISQFGYYRPHGRTLLVNTAAGRGPLLHEMTHALVAFDMPELPQWFDEGLASLYEECRIDADPPRITGLANWRDRELEAAVRAGRLPPLAEFVGPASSFGRNPGRDYAYARGWCRFLQDRGLLVAFYHRLRSDRLQGGEGDRSGERALCAVLGRQAWARAETDFRRFVLANK